MGTLGATDVSVSLSDLLRRASVLDSTSAFPSPITGSAKKTPAKIRLPRRPTTTAPKSAPPPIACVPRNRRVGARM
jgi:hypothetical protein